LYAILTELDDLEGDLMEDAFCELFDDCVVLFVGSWLVLEVPLNTDDDFLISPDLFRDDLNF